MQVGDSITGKIIKVVLGKDAQLYYTIEFKNLYDVTTKERRK